MQNGKPVIFLAFANDHQSYLYKLTEEQDGIRTALDKAEEKGLCEVVYETDTDVDKIFRVFDKYQDRIAIFHYGGHAEDYTLLLKAADGSRQYANSDGLMNFLAAQKGLQLVFINGCSSKQQAEKLRSLGVPVVVGTSQPIDDAAATILSTQFYESLSTGRTIAQSWEAAAAKVKTRTNAAEGYRAVWPGHKSKDKPRIEFPWELYVRPGAETVTEWNLPRAARNPLFGLPLPERYYANLPPAPFLGLNYFQENDAALFFGRGAQIRSLRSHIDGVHPIILFYGKSGVGKSSLLYAGLLPRIKDQFTVLYLRRDQALGLRGTLAKGLGTDLSAPDPIEEDPERQQKIIELLDQLKAALPEKAIAADIAGIIKRLESPTLPGAELTNILQTWRSIEGREGKPLIVILDQVEEHYTRPMEGADGMDELINFLHAIHPLFSSDAKAIEGKLILSYRKEYHPEIRDTFQALKFPYAEVFLKRLDREGVVEAITGVTADANIQAKYRLEITSNSDDSLPDTLADDLLEDQDSPIAPVLQIILKKLWESAREENEDEPRFSPEQYRQLKKTGISMGEFFEQQMALLAADMPEAVQSGLALDLLKHHTSDLGTAGRCSREKLKEYYKKRMKTIDRLIDKCIEFSLLLRIDKNNTVLAHDILAPVVIREFNISDRPGQKAMRVLANRRSGWLDGKTGEILDEQDLNILEAGVKGRRHLNADEKRMLAASKKAQQQRLRQLQRLMLAGIVLITFVIYLLFRMDLFAKLDTAVKDYMLQPHSNLVTVAIDDTTANSLGLTPLRGENFLAFRQHHAIIVDMLSESGASVIAFNICFIDSSDHDSLFNLAIARAKERGTQIVFGVDCDDDWEPTYSLDAVGESYGSVKYLDTGDDLAIRLYNEDDELYPFAMKVLYPEASDSSQVGRMLENGNTLYISFLSAEDNLQNHSYYDVLQGETPAGGWKDKIALVGFRLAPSYYIPQNMEEGRYGLDVQANAINNLLQAPLGGTFWQILITLLIIGLNVFYFVKFRERRIDPTLFTLIESGVFVGLAIFIYNIFYVLLPIAVAIAAIIWSIQVLTLVVKAKFFPVLFGHFS